MTQTSNQYREPHTEDDDVDTDSAADWDSDDALDVSPEFEPVSVEGAAGVSRSRRRIEQYFESKQLADWLTEVFDEPSGSPARRRALTRPRRRGPPRSVRH